MNATNQQLEEIAQLAEKQLNLELEILNLEERLTSVKEKHAQVSMTLIPEAMMAVGMESFKLADGTMVKVEKFYSGKIPEDKTNAAFDWLRSSGNDSLIKRNVTVAFGKGEDAQANLAVQALKSMNLEPMDKSSVHPMTLKSFIREQFESGSDFPADLFGAFVGNKTKIAPPRKLNPVDNQQETL